MKEWAEQFYKSDKWKRCRKAYIAERILIDGGLCEVCHKKPGYIVHHKIKLTPKNINDAEVSLNHKYLQYDCKDCHDREEIHAFIKSKPLKCAFDKNGCPIPIPP